MVALKNLNSSPALIQHLVDSRVFASIPLTVIDIGARGGFEKHWSVFGDQVKLIGFEADAEECKKLNQQVSGSQNRFFPYALHRDKGKRPFYVTAYPPSSGFYHADMSFMKRFQDEVNLAVTKTIEMDTVDLDSLIAANGMGPIDFIKLDTEGNELDILEGAINCLKKSVIGLSIEAEFLQMHYHQPVFSDIDSFLRNLGFRLYDLTVYRLGRKSLPPITASPIPGAVERGQIIPGQALYLRDGVEEIESGVKVEDGWNDINVLKLASIMELFCLPDCAIELVQVARSKGILQNRDTGYFIDLLVPPVGKEKVSYEEYLERVKRAKLGKLETSSGNVRRIRGFLVKLVPSPVSPLIRGILIKLRDFINILVNG